MDKPVANMVLVPREPTDEMLQAFEDEYVCMFGASLPSPWSKAEKLFAAMIEAAPQPSLEGEVGELVERLDTQAWEHKLTGIVRQKHDKPSIGMAEGDYEPLVRRSVAAALLLSLSADNARLREEEARHYLSFDLRWKSDMRAIERWQKATGRTMTMPDHTDLSVWLFGQLEAAESRLSEAVEVLEIIAGRRHAPDNLMGNADYAIALLDTQGGGNG